MPVRRFDYPVIAVAALFLLLPLAMIGLVDHKWLIKNWKFSVVGAFILGAMLTPPDPLTQIALAVPLVVLYLLSIGLAYVISTNKKKKEAS